MGRDILLAVFAFLCMSYLPSTVLLYSTSTGRPELARFSLSVLGANPNIVHRDGTTPLWRAVFSSDAAVTALLLEGGARPNAKSTVGSHKDMTPLMLAAMTGSVDCAEQLLKHKAAVEERDGTKAWSALMFAASGGHGAAIKVLLDHRAIVDARDPHGATALMMAALSGHTEAAEVLLTRGASVNAKSKQGMTVSSQPCVPGARGHTFAVGQVGGGAWRTCTVCWGPHRLWGVCTASPLPLLSLPNSPSQ